MKKQDEYNALRNEILSKFQTVNQYNWSTILATGAILGLAMGKTTPNPFFFLAPLFVILPNMLNYALGSRSIRQTGAYLQVFHEQGNPELNWEKRCWRFNETDRVVTYANPLLRFATMSTFLGLAIVCLFLAWQTWTLAIWSYLLVLLVVLSYLCGVMVLVVDMTGHRQRCVQEWEKIRDEERANKPDAGDGL